MIAETGDLIQYQSLISRTIYRLVSDYEVTRDLTQDVYERLLKLPNLDTLHPAYIRTTATNIAIDHLRHNHRIQWISIDEYECSSDDFEDRVINRMTDRQSIIAAMHYLSQYDRYVLLLIAYRFSYVEIASILGIATVPALKMQIFRARERFRAAYQEEKEDCHVSQS